MYVVYKQFILFGRPTSTFVHSSPFQIYFIIESQKVMQNIILETNLIKTNAANGS